MLHFISFTNVSCKIKVLIINAVCINQRSPGLFMVSIILVLSACVTEILLKLCIIFVLSHESTLFSYVLLHCFFMLFFYLPVGHSDIN
jgi:hypothetical protein